MIKKILFSGCLLLTLCSAVAQSNYIVQQSDIEIFAEQISLSPNPASEKLKIGNDTNTILIVTIYNILGDSMITKNIDVNGGYIDITNLQAGVYIVSFTDGKRIITKRLVKK